jgi:hypothetical protein
MNCISCNKYFKMNVFNKSSECEECLDLYYINSDSELEVDLNLLRNPSGKTVPVFYYDPEDDIKDY